MGRETTIAVYIRLSLEDESFGESNSVINQRALLNDFLDRHPELSQYRRIELCDDGFSGVNFNRPSVQKLLKMVRNGEVNCIVCKDISRFGRNYIEVGDYIENVFPFLGIRFVSVSDNYDSASQDSSVGGIEVALRTLVYDLYSKDLSEKVRSAKHSKMKKGEFINAYAIFGYKKSPDDKHKLVIDDEAAKIVRQVFDLAVNGKKTTEIARILNEQSTPTLSEYKRSQGVNKWDNCKYGKSLWTTEFVRKILSEIRYTGTWTTGMTEIVGISSKKTRFKQRSEWNVFPDMFEPIVSKETYDLVNARFKIKGTIPQKDYEHSLFFRKIVCHNCNRNMERSHDGEIIRLICRTRTVSHSPNCVQHGVPEKLVEEVVLSAINEQMKLSGANVKMREKRVRKIQNKMSDCRKSLKQFQESVIRLNNTKQRYYEDFSDGVIDREEYMRLKSECDAKLEKFQVDSADVSEKLIELESQLADCESAKLEREKYSGIAKLTREIVDALVEKIIVYDKERIEVVWKFNDIFGG